MYVAGYISQLNDTWNACIECKKRLHISVKYVLAYA